MPSDFICPVVVCLHSNFNWLLNLRRLLESNGLSIVTNIFNFGAHALSNKFVFILSWEFNFCVVSQNIHLLRFINYSAYEFLYCLNCSLTISWVAFEINFPWVDMAIFELVIIFKLVSYSYLKLLGKCEVWGIG